VNGLGGKVQVGRNFKIPETHVIPFESLVKSITKLRMKDKFRLWELLDEQMAHAEEKTWQERFKDEKDE